MSLDGNGATWAIAPRTLSSSKPRASLNIWGSALCPKEREDTKHAGGVRGQGYGQCRGPGVRREMSGSSPTVKPLIMVGVNQASGM